MNGVHRILVVGGSPRASLEYCRSLGAAGHRVALLRWDARRSIADASRYCAQSVYLGALEAGVDDWMARFRAWVERERISDVVPVDDLAHELLCSDSSQLLGTIRVHGPSARTYRLASDRARVIATASAAGLRTLATQRLTFGDAVPTARMPGVLRPVRTVSIKDDEPAFFSVKWVRDVAELDAKLRDDLPRVDVLLQDPPRGERIDICVGARNGRVVALAVAVHEESSGASLRSERPGADVKHAADCIAAELAFTGVLRIECVRHGTELTFVDLRCGGGEVLALCARAGVDLPREMFEWTEGHAPGDLRVSVPGVRVRHLGTSLLNRGIAPRRNREPDVRRPLAFVGGFGQLEVERWSDLKPGAAQFLSAASWLARKAGLYWRRHAWSLRGDCGRTPSLAPETKVLFVCKGNINRSFVAEQVLRSLGYERVASAGLIGMGGRLPSPAAEAFVRERTNREVAAFRSQSIRSALRKTGGVDVVVCFEREHALQVVERHPELKGKVALLSRLAGDTRPIDIPDPHGKPGEVYDACFRRIEELLRKAFDTPVRTPSR